MSIIDQLPPRLCWDGRRGIAVGTGAMMTLAAPPYIGVEFVELDYAPAVHVCLIRRAPGSPINDMAGDEIAACRRFLAALE